MHCGSPARFRVLIVDSCRAGVLTRVKGGRAAAPVDITAYGEGDSDDEGLVILTSAAAGEDAQDAVRIDIERYFHLRNAARRGRNAIEPETPKRHVVVCHRAFTLQDVNIHGGLVIRGGGISFSLADRNGCVAFDRAPD